MLPGRVDNLGRLYVVTGVPGPTEPRRGGIVQTADGQVYIAINQTPDLFVNGFGLITAVSKALCVADGGVIDHFLGGLPFTKSGQLVIQQNTVPVATDPYVGGIRVGPLGGVYVSGLTPPADDPWSTGFSSGFGNGP